MANSSNIEQEYCSWCFQRTRHVLYEANLLSRNVYRCRRCKNLTVQCRYCSRMAAGPLDPDQDSENKGFLQQLRGHWHDELCAEHNGSVRSFAGLNAKLQEIEDHESLFIRSRYNLLRVAKITGGVAAGAALLTPLAVVAAPHIAVSLGTAGALGAAGTGTAISSLSGAALTSASLAAVGGGTMASGVFVVTATGASLGGALGGRISNAYYSEVKDFKLRKQNEGRGASVICIDGFLTQKQDDPREWKRALRQHGFRSHPWYHLNWEAKTRYNLGSVLCRDTGGGVARRYGTKLAERAAKKGGSKINPLMWAATVADLFDNPWHLAMAKAAMTGVLLADILARTQRKQFILIGHSLGARVIYYALLALATRTAKPLVRDAFLLGGAVGVGKARDWDDISVAVAGTINNCYSANDLVLKGLYRGATALISRPIGAYPIKSKQPNIRNWDFSNVVPSHTAWKGVLGDVMARIKAES